MALKLITRRKLAFRNPATGAIVVAEPFAFSTLPDWIEQDPMYQFAISDGTIELADGAKKREQKA